MTHDSDDLLALRSAWHSASTPPPTLDMDLLDTLRQDASKLDRTLLWRDVREIGVAILLALYFAFQLGRPASEMLGTVLGNVVLCAAALWIASVLLTVRLRHRRPLPGASVLQALRAERDGLAAQTALLRWAWLWYVLPIWIGAMLYVGLPSTAVGWISSSLMTLLCLGIAWVNRRAARKDLQPMHDRTVALLDGFR